MKKPTLAKLAAAAISVPALLGISSLPAVGQSSPPVAGIRLAGSAKIAATGAVVYARALIACPSGDEAYVQVQLTERAGNGIAQGSNYAQAICNGNIQGVTIPVSPQNKPFVSGIAFGQATISVIDPSGYNSNTDNRNVKLH